MSKYTVTHHAPGRCNISHDTNNSIITTDLPPEYGGSGRSFSSTDLVAAALGSCYLSSIETILEREGFDLGKVHIAVRKELMAQPKRIKSISLKIYTGAPVSYQLKQKLDRAIGACPVKRSLHPDIVLRWETITAPAPATTAHPANHECPDNDRTD